MSLTVFSARSIANDLESAVGEEAFYFYMREIIERKLFEEYVDDVNGEVKQFANLIDFMTNKDGLNIKDLPLLDDCLAVVASSNRKVANEAQWLLGKIRLDIPSFHLGDNQHNNERLKSQSGTGGSYNVIPSREGNSRDYLLRRIARDQPDLLNEIGHGKRFKSARAAAIEAGIITPFPSLQLKEPAPTAQKLLAKMGQAWCLQLLEELSELCL
jgi:hypothetical protein